MSRSIWTDFGTSSSVKKDQGKRLPAKWRWFAALDAPPDEVKVVILGTGSLSRTRSGSRPEFFCRGGQRIPPSLQNIFRELASDLGCEPPVMEISLAGQHRGADAQQRADGRAGRAGSHQGKGWELYRCSHSGH